MSPKIKPEAASKKIADALGLSHFLVTNFIVLIGEFTSLFNFMKTKHGGIDFVKTYISAPGLSILSVLVTCLEVVMNWTIKGMYWVLSNVMDKKLQEASKTSVTFVNDFFKDQSFIGLFLSTEAVIVFASALYWVVCYYSTRFILAATH